MRPAESKSGASASDESSSDDQPKSAEQSLGLLVRRRGGERHDDWGQWAKKVQKKSGIQILLSESLTSDVLESVPGPLGFLAFTADVAAEVLVALAAVGTVGGIARERILEGSVIAMLEAPVGGLAVLQEAAPSRLLFHLSSAEQEPPRWPSEWKASAPRADGWLAMPSLAIAVFYPDGSVEALQDSLVLWSNRRDLDDLELLAEDGNAFRLPSGFAPHQSPMTVAAGWIAEGNVLAFTGAGISKESGVPTFRDGSGLWQRYDAMEVSSIGGLAGEPAKVWAFEREFNEILSKCGPNPGHQALANLGASGHIDVVVTQNVDGFHQASGSKEVLELHGSEVHAICLNQACGKRTEMSRIFDGNDLWSVAKGWGVRWPPQPSDTPLQTAVREQLAALVLRSQTRDSDSSDSDSSSESKSSSPRPNVPSRSTLPKALTE